VALDINESRTLPAGRPDPRFYSTRNKVSLGLLVFIVVFGLPIIGVPALRHRLSTRVMALKTAMSGEITPATIQAGSNHEPLPPEFARPEPPTPRAPVMPDLNRIFSMNGRPVSVAPDASRPEPSRSARSVPANEATPQSAATEQDAQASPTPATASGETEPKYQKGKAEQEAYEVLLKGSPAVADLVQGKDPSMKFISWDATNRGEDTYWVRLRFRTEGNTDAEYIWQVKVMANQAIPLNFNARNIAP
jgi:hypothetical protein